MNKLPKRAMLSQYPVTVMVSISGIAVLLLFIVLLLSVGEVEGYPQREMIIFSSVGIAICVAVLAYRYFWVRLFRYELDGTEVKIEKGVIAKSHDSILYSRIQNVNIKRSLWERILGLSTVIIQTAGSSIGPEGVLPGVSKETAEQINDQLSGNRG